MARDTSSEILDVLVQQLGNNPAFIDAVARHVTSRLVGVRRDPPSASPRAPLFSPRPARAAAPAKKAGGRVRGGATERVLAAIKSGASKRVDIMSKSGVSAAGYSYGIKVLKDRGQIKVQGDRGQARILVV